MAIFKWDEQTTCGDETPVDTCAPLDAKTSIRSLRGTSIQDGCEVDLIAADYPALACLVGDEQTDARSGSAAHPIPLGKVQKYTGKTIPELFFRNGAGNLASWDPPNTCDNKKVVIDSGSFTYEDDINSNVFSEACIGSIEDVELIAGGTEFVDCNGVTRVKLVFFPKEQFCDICS
jgi:hypothetical protein